MSRKHEVQLGPNITMKYINATAYLLTYRSLDLEMLVATLLLWKVNNKPITEKHQL